MLMEDPKSRAFAPLAEAHRKAGRLDDAINVAKAGLEIHPGYSGGLVVLGRAFYEKGELDNAAEILKKAVSETPESYLGQKFLGKVFIDKGEISGALRALEAANLLSPEDEEVVRLLDEVKSKATPPETMEYDENEAESEVKAQIVTYEQKPTTIDGVELVPLPTRKIDDTFSFSGGSTTDPADITPVPEGEEVAPALTDVSEITASEIAGEDMAATVIEEEEVEQAMDIESLDELGPEAAAFIQEGEDLMEDSVEGLPDDEAFVVGDVLEEEVIEPAGAGSPPGDPHVATAAAEVSGEQVQPVSDPISVPESPLSSGTDSGYDAVAQTSTIEVPSFASNNAEASTVAQEVMVDETEPKPLQVAESEFPSAAPAPPETPSLNVAREEQFSTETLADLYAQQGLDEKAANIYQQILDQTPDNEMVRLKLEALKVQVPSAPGTVQEVRPPDIAHPERPRKDSNDEALRVLEGWLGNVERIKRP
jgi:tetratricopeptide (TPR) repeat protein